MTKDNVAITIDGVLYVRVVDPRAASYGVENPIYALSQLAQTTMRSEIGKISLDKTFEERDHLNARIVSIINTAAAAWGLKCLRYEIRDILPPTGIKVAMEMQAEAERRKRATVLESEAEREAQVNRAEGIRQKVILEANAEAESIKVRARATAEALTTVGEELMAPGGGGMEAARVRVAELYLKEFGRIAKAGNTVLLPADAGNPAAMVAQAMAAMGATGGGSFGGFGGGGGGGISGGVGGRNIKAGSRSRVGVASAGGDSDASSLEEGSSASAKGGTSGSYFSQGGGASDAQQQEGELEGEEKEEGGASTRRLRAAARRALKAEAGGVGGSGDIGVAFARTILSSGGGGDGGAGGGANGVEPRRVRLSSD